jgi:hypothetical protein
VDLLDLIDGLRRLFPRAAAVTLIVGFTVFPSQSTRLMTAIIHQRAAAISSELNKVLAPILPAQPAHHPAR